MGDAGTVTGGKVAGEGFGTAQGNRPAQVVKVEMRIGASLWLVDARRGEMPCLAEY